MRRRSSSQQSQVYVFEIDNFLLQVQQQYSHIKHLSKIQNKKQSSYQPSKFSLPFQQHYPDLSFKFDRMIKKTNINFDQHRNSIEDQENSVEQLMRQMTIQERNTFQIFLARLLLRSQRVYQKWMKEQVELVKEQIQTVITKNCDLQAKLGQNLLLNDQLEQRLQQEENFRFDLQTHISSIQKQLMSLKQQNANLSFSNKSLLVSKKQLDWQIAQQKLNHNNLTQQVITQEDSMLEQQRKNHKLSKQNTNLKAQIISLQTQLLSIKKQHQQLQRQITHLTELVQNQQCQLDFYKGHQNRQSNSGILQSYQKLNSYGEYLQNYNKTSSKESLRGIMLSHQKSMGKLTIFQHKDPYDRINQKISQSDMSLQSFECGAINHLTNLGSKNKDDSFYFNQFNQVTFRPDIQAQFSGLKLKDKAEKIQIQRANSDRVEKFNFTGKKHSRQRSQSITQGNSTVHKKLIYDQIKQDDQNDQQSVIQNAYQNQDQISPKSSTGSNQKVKSVIVDIYPRFISQINTQFKNKKQVIKDQQKISSASVYDTKSRSEVNSVNRVLIKKNIKIQKQIEQLIEEIQKAQEKIEQYEDLVDQLSDKINFYKQQLSKANELKIRYKSEIEAYIIEVDDLQNDAEQLENQVNQKDAEIAHLKNHFIQLNQSLSDQQQHYQERITKIKEFCKNYLEEKHKKQIELIKNTYQTQIIVLETQILKIKQKLLSLQKVKADFCVQTLQKKLSSHGVINQKIQSKRVMKSKSLQTQNEEKTIQIYPQFSMNLSKDIQRYLLQKNQLQKKFQITQNFSFQISRPTFMKSPLLFKKQLLNTPSNINTHDTRKYTIQSGKLSQQSKSSKKSSKSLNLQELHCPLAQEYESSFETVMIAKDLQQEDNQNQNDSFFSCIQLSKDFISAKQERSVQDIFVVKKDFYNSGIVSIKSSQAFQSANQSFSQFRSLKFHKSMDQIPQYYKVCSSPTSVHFPQSQSQQNEVHSQDLPNENIRIQPLQRSTKTDLKQISRPIQDQNNSCIQQRDNQIPSNDLNNINNQITVPVSSDYYYKVNIIQEGVDIHESKQYSSLFEKNFKQYFKHHTLFQINKVKLNHRFVPNPQKMYVIYANYPSIQSLQNQSQNHGNFENNHKEDIKLGNTRFILYKKVLFNCQTQQKLEIPKNSSFKYILQDTRLTLGNFQIMIGYNKLLKIARSNKRCYYIGNIQDRTWQINKIQEVQIISNFKRK